MSSQSEDNLDQTHYSDTEGKGETSECVKDIRTKPQKQKSKYSSSQTQTKKRKVNGNLCSLLLL